MFSKSLLTIASAAALFTGAIAQADHHQLSSAEAYQTYFYGELADVPEVLVQSSGAVKVYVKENAALYCELVRKGGVYKIPTNSYTLNCSHK